LTELSRHGGFGRMMDLIRRRQQKVDDLTYRLTHGQGGLPETHRRRFDHLPAAVRHYDLRMVLSGIRKDLNAKMASMASAGRSLLQQKRARLERLTSQMEALSPVAILDRGYALVFDASGKLVKDVTQVNEGDDISARLAQGKIIATV